MLQSLVGLLFLPDSQLAWHRTSVAALLAALAAFLELSLNTHMGQNADDVHENLQRCWRHGAVALFSGYRATPVYG